jgi:hypothetical protein
MVSHKKFDSVDGTTSRFLSDLTINSEQFVRVYNYFYNAGGVEGEIDPTTGLPTRVNDFPNATEDLITLDKWDLVDNSILFYTNPAVTSSVWIEVATTPEEFGETLAAPIVVQASGYADDAEASATAAALSETNAAASEVAAAASAASIDPTKLLHTVGEGGGDPEGYTTTELNGGQLDNRYYTETETDVITDEIREIAETSSYKNKVINGRFWHDQEGVAFADMFKAANTSGTGSWTPTQIAGGGGRLTITTAITDITGVKYFNPQTRVEAYNIYELNSETITISFKFKAKINGTYSLCIQNSAGDRSYVTDFSYTGSEAYQTITKTITLEAATISAFNSSIGLYMFIGGQNTGTYQTTTVDAWHDGSYYVSDAATNYVGTAGNYIEIDELQLEKGAVSTKFERTTWDDELKRCKRYFEAIASDPTNGKYFAAGYASLSTQALFSLFYKKKRTVPTLSTTGGSDFAVKYLATSTALSSIAFSVISDASCRAVATTTGLTAGQGVLLINNTAVYPTIFVDARL